MIAVLDLIVRLLDHIQEFLCVLVQEFDFKRNLLLLGLKQLPVVRIALILKVFRWLELLFVYVFETRTNLVLKADVIGRKLNITAD